MGRTYDRIDGRLGGWLTAQPVFFVATAPLDGGGHINCSPKGNRGEFTVLDDRTVAYLDQTGSGIETIAHLRENGRMVCMFCAFEGPPRIVRLHGIGRPVLTGDPDFPTLRSRMARDTGIGERAIIVMAVERVADSCGYSVPLMPFSDHRPTLDEWTRRKGEDGIRAYWTEKNAASIDGLSGLPL